MAKVKLDWFKLDCQMDDKIELIEAEFGLTGFALVVKLFQRIYGGQGYYCEWNADVALVFARKVGVGANVVSEIISACIRRGIFDERMLSEFGILTSHGIQTRYFESDAIQRRKLENLNPKYLLVKCAHFSDNADISSKNADIFSKNADIFSQRREEKKRVDKSRAEKRRADAISVSASTSTLAFVTLSSEQYTQLTARYPKHIVDDYIQRVDDYAKSKGRGYPDYAVVIARWIDQDVKSGKTSPSEPSYDSDEWGKMVDSFDPSML